MKKKMKKNARYEKELFKLQVELNYLQRWVKETGEKAIIIFEGRDSAGKGGAIKRVTERVSPRVFQTIALPAPNEREKTQIYVQRWITHFPAAGEIILFDRSWYNRGGVEPVMGFCTEKEHRRFLDTIPNFEKSIVDNGVRLIKLWFEIDKKTQEKRFKARIDDERKQWKLSPMDIQSYKRWYDYSRARDSMLEATHSTHAPWHIIDSNDKKTARLNAISLILSQFPYEKIKFDKPILGKRQKNKGYKEPDWSLLDAPKKYDLIKG
jgi:polyphosphate kinase 2